MQNCTNFQVARNGKGKPQKDQHEHAFQCTLPLTIPINITLFLSVVWLSHYNFYEDMYNE